MARELAHEAFRVHLLFEHLFLSQNQKQNNNNNDNHRHHPAKQLK